LKQGRKWFERGEKLGRKRRETGLKEEINWGETGEKLERKRRETGEKEERINLRKYLPFTNLFTSLLPTSLLLFYQPLYSPFTNLFTSLLFIQLSIIIIYGLMSKE
jgi:hypothetical protein